MKKIITVVLCLTLTMLLILTAGAETDGVARVGNTAYATVAEAVAAANGQTVTLLADSQESVTVSGDIYLDLNGHTLAGLTVENGTLYGMDTTTDDYDCSDGYGSITSITGDYAAHHQVDVNDNPQKYLAVREETGVSFHRIYLGITHQSLQPAKQGVGYKSLFAADSVAADKIESYGYALWLNGYNKITRWKDGSSFVSGNTLSLRVVNYDADNYGETTLYATVQLKLKDGTVISSQEQAVTLQQMVQSINGDVSAYTQEQIDALTQWIIGSDAMASWEVKNILFPVIAFDMNAGADLVVENAAFAGNLESITVQGTELTLENATLEDGVLTIPAASFVQSTMPSGTVTLQVTTDRRQVEFDGSFTWVVNSWADLAYRANHLIFDGSGYTGSLALGADIQIPSGANLGNFAIFQKDTVFNGSFDGRGYTVSNMTPKATTALFGTLGESGVVKNLKLTNVQLSTYGGGVAYICKGTLDNIFVQGTVTADGMGTSSPLANFGCGLLAGQYYATAKVSNCMVELSSIADGLRLATALGQLRSGVTESIFTNCDAIGADSCTYIFNSAGAWTKTGFGADTNTNYTDRTALMSSEEGALRYIALRPAVDFVEQDTHDYTVSDAVHSYQITDTDQFIDSTYSIVISKTADEDTLTAANDFASLFRTATGLRIGRVYAENVTYSASSKYIVIGDNSVSRGQGIHGDDLGTQGFRIRTVDNSIFVVGADSQGVQFGVYELLYQLFHYDCFGIDGYTIDKNVTQIPLKNYDITDVPDIGIRRSNYHYLTMDSVTERRMRLTYFGDYIIPVGDKMVHNSSQYISKEDYPDKTDWFSTDGENLCYTAHGNETEKAQMQSIIANIIIEKLEANPDKNAIGMMQEDNSTLCDCESCTAMQEHYNGAQVASVIIFLNRVCELVDAHFGGERDFTVLFFAYHATSQPPVVYDAQTGTYAPVDDQVLLNSHLKPFFADTDGDYTKDFYNADTANAEAAEQMNGWAALSEEMHFWMYGTNFSFYLIPYNTFDAMQANYKYAIEHGTDFIYDQGQASQSGTATGWSNLKIYLYSKLTWNVNQDREELIDRFMEGYYGPAADTVKDVFYSWKFVANYQTNELGFIGSRTIYKSLLKKEYWNQAVLIDWTARLEQAMQEVAHLQSTDPDSYAKYMKNIAAERIAYNFLLLELFQDTMTQEQIQTAKDQFYHDYQQTKIGYQQDREEPVSDLLIKWGIISA